jgi:predicted O-methyltransferase YrrM
MINAQIKHPLLFGIKYFLKLAEAESETSVPERAMLRKYASGRHRLAEVGVFCGVNSRAFRAVMAADGTLLAIDPYFRRKFSLRGFGMIRLVAHHEVSRSSNGKVIWVECLGSAAPARQDVQAQLPLDFLFIDGDHTYEGVAKDWSAWKELIAPGGMVCLHDSRNTGGLGVERFLNDRIVNDSGYRIIDSVDTLTVLERVSG